MSREITRVRICNGAFIEPVTRAILVISVNLTKRFATGIAGERECTFWCSGMAFLDKPGPCAAARLSFVLWSRTVWRARHASPPCYSLPPIIAYGEADL